MAFLRASKKLPCPICGKADWCLVAKDGTAAICPRTESSRRVGEAGFLHRLNGDGPRRDARPSRTRRAAVGLPLNRRRDITLEAGKLHQRAIDNGHLVRLAFLTGIAPSAYVSLGVGWSRRDHAWTFPLSIVDGTVVGLNRRFLSGEKRVRRGDSIGLYLPSDLPRDLSGQTLLVAEGGTDTAAALLLGQNAIGRFSCNTSVREVIGVAKKHEPSVVVILADADGPGRRGAEDLAAALVPHAPTIKLVEPPARDLRAWLNAGADTLDLRALIDRTEARRLSIGGGHA